MSHKYKTLRLASKVLVILLALTIEVGAADLSRFVLYGGHAIDLATTEIALRRGYSEANPLLVDRTQRLVVSTGAVIGFDLATRWIERRRPKLARTLRFGLGGSKIAIGIGWNLKRN